MEYGGRVNRLSTPGTATVGVRHTLPTAVQVLAEFPYEGVERTYLDNRVRTPMRRIIQDKIQHIQAHWTHLPIGEMKFMNDAVKVQVRGGDEDVQIQNEDEPLSGNIINARCLLLLGVDPSFKERHLLRRVNIVAGTRFADEGRSVVAYGGVVLAGNECQVITQLIKHVKDQSYLDLAPVKTWIKWLTIEYSDTGPTVFYVPALWELDSAQREKLIMIPQCAEEVDTVEEKYESVEIDEDATVAAVLTYEKRKAALKEQRRQERVAKGLPVVEEEEEPADKGPEKIMKRVQRTRMLNKVTRTKVLTPVRMSLANLAEFTLRTATDADTVELCVAADALDEFFKREMTTRILSSLRELERSGAAQKAREARAAEQESRKRKRQGEDESRKRARNKEIADLTAAWAKQDDGLTGEEKKEMLRNRATTLKKMREEYAAEDKQRELLRETESQAQQEDAKSTAQRVDPDLMEAYSYFERLPGLTSSTGTLPRLKIITALLAREKDLSVQEIEKLFAAADLPKGDLVNYRVLAALQGTGKQNGAPSVSAPQAPAAPQPRITKAPPAPPRGTKAPPPAGVPTKMPI
eukprot:Hpha_TRINITY_DN16226_c2_g11::TRINITY_DN16226_c2_g11_i1::g.15139::m.15139